MALVYQILRKKSCVFSGGLGSFMVDSKNLLGEVGNLASEGEVPCVYLFLGFTINSPTDSKENLHFPSNCGIIKV